MLYHPGKIAAFGRLTLARGIAAVVVGFPATPLLTGRARICISAAHTSEDLDRAIEALDEVAEECALKHNVSAEFKGNLGTSRRSPCPTGQICHHHCGQLYERTVCRLRILQIASFDDICGAEMVHAMLLQDPMTLDYNPGWGDSAKSQMTNGFINGDAHGQKQHLVG